jgi:hypothetical protein
MRGRHRATKSEPGQEPGDPQRPARWWKLALVGLVGVFATLAVYDLTSMSGGLGSAGAASASGRVSPAAATRTGGTSPSAPASAAPATSPAATPATSPASSPASHSLSVASIAAFGPDGTSDGDNPAIVSRINGGGQPWYSSWYATPEFGDLQAGTGLLLDMGNQVTVSSVRLVLGSQQGADVQVLVGDATALGDMSIAATATNVGGTVRLSTPARASGRYVLIWFTALPPNGQGKYQVSVYGATVDGTAA